MLDLWYNCYSHESCHYNIQVKFMALYHILCGDPDEQCGGFRNFPMLGGGNILWFIKALPIFYQGSRVGKDELTIDK